MVIIPNTKRKKVFVMGKTNVKASVSRYAHAVKEGRITLDCVPSEIRLDVAKMIAPVSVSTLPVKAIAEVNDYFSKERASVWIVVVKNGDTLYILKESVTFWKNQLFAFPEMVLEDVGSKENNSRYQLRLNFKAWFRANYKTAPVIATFPVDVLKKYDIGETMESIVNREIHAERSKRKKAHKKINPVVAWNTGYKAEQLICDCFGINWELNLKPYTESGDIVINGVHVQIKSHIENMPQIRA